MPMPRCVVALGNRFQNGMIVAWHGRGVMFESNMAALRESNGKESKPLAARHGRGTAWARHENCIICVS
jgi:hypothetical protein